MSLQPRFVPCGDRCLLIYLGDRIEPAINDAVLALARSLRANPHPALVEVIGSYHCVLVEYDPLRIRLDQLEEMVRGAVATPAKHARPHTVSIPVCYGGEFGPDLAEVAAHTGLPPEEIIRRHSSSSYRVYALGFSPGFPYMGGLDEQLATPRLADPRTRVEAGSVGIAGNQTGVYPTASPGGWRLIGRTPMRLFDPGHAPPSRVEPGDTVRFVPVNPETYAGLALPERATTPAPPVSPGWTGLRIIQPGPATTIQDLGRRGYMMYGVPVAGAADFWSLMVGNWLLSNRARTSALEVTLGGLEVEFTGPIVFAVTGAPTPAELIPGDGSAPRPIPLWASLLATPGDRLRLGTPPTGCRSYLCVAGGIDLPPVLGSLSEDLFAKVGPLGRVLKAGDWLPIGLPLQPPANLAGPSVPAHLLPKYGGTATIRVVRGPQAERFSPSAYAAFFGGVYTVGANSDRQGLRLQGPKLEHAGPADILSEPLAPGAVQVPNSGQPILLLGNRQTTGGYAQIGVAVWSDLAAASQLRPGDKLRFQEVDVAEAHAVVRSERRKLAQVRRYLEREAKRRPELVEREIAERIANQVATRPEQTLPVPDATSQQGPTKSRTLRLRINDMEFEAEIEEVD